MIIIDLYLHYHFFPCATREVCYGEVLFDVDVALDISARAQILQGQGCVGLREGATCGGVLLVTTLEGYDSRAIEIRHRLIRQWGMYFWRILGYLTMTQCRTFA